VAAPNYREELVDLGDSGVGEFRYLRLGRIARYRKYDWEWGRGRVVRAKSV
jgi:hypothetical protein